MTAMKKRIINIIALLALTFALPCLLGGCLGSIFPKRQVTGTRPVSTPGSPQMPSQAEATMFQEAEQAQRAGQLDTAARKYEEFLKVYPNSRNASSALASLGQIHEKQGNKEKAADAYWELYSKYGGSPLAEEAGVRLAGLSVELGRYTQAQQVLAELLASETNPEEKARLRLLLAKSYLGNGNRGQALDLYKKALDETADSTDRAEAQLGMKAAVQTMPLEELPQAQTQFGSEFPGGYVSYALAYRLYEAGKVDEAKDQLEYFITNFPDHEMSKDAEKFKQAIADQQSPPKMQIAEGFSLAAATQGPGPDQPVMPEGPVGEYRTMDVACLLPLSQSNASKYGKRVLTGLQMAFKTYQAQTPGFKSNLVVLDTQGQTGIAADQLDQVSGRGNILAVVGPLLSKTALYTAPRADQAGMPMLTITQKTGVPQMGRHVFRLFLTPKAQAEAVARYAIQVLGMTRLAILHPNDAYGNTMRDFFRNEVQRMGGQIVAVDGYDPKGTEFSANIQKLAGVGKAVRKVGAGRKVQVEFEAVFLPDSYRAVAMIAPQFAYHDIMTHRFLGTSLWHTPRILSTTARYVQNCVIPTAFFPESESSTVVKFVEAYRAETGDATSFPDQFTAYGYDAGMLLLNLMDKGHISSREDLVSALENMGPYPGVTGRFTFDGEGEYRSEPTLITVEGTEFKALQ
jgi:branched-chain amino acid transport system substrate-binding protein